MATGTLSPSSGEGQTPQVPAPDGPLGENCEQDNSGLDNSGLDNIEHDTRSPPIVEEDLLGGSAWLDDDPWEIEFYVGGAYPTSTNLNHG